MSLDAFIEKNFDGQTTQKQIQRQKFIIDQAQKEIERLSGLLQTQKPWYSGDGVRFGFVTSLSDYEFKSYNEFTKHVCLFLDPAAPFFLDPAIPSTEAYDFYAISPTGERHIIPSEVLLEMDLVKEYFDNIELEKRIAEMQKLVNEKIKKSLFLSHEITEYKKYLPAYINEMRFQILVLQNEIETMQKDIVEAYFKE